VADVSYQDFVAFFEAKKKGIYECAFCGSQHFIPAQAMTPGQVGELSIQMIPSPGIVMSGYHSFFSIVCTNCGRIDLFHSATVRNWKAARDAGLS
jgi:predicted nucleic-acid-binding Zn-ribbon protein